MGVQWLGFFILFFFAAAGSVLFQRNDGFPDFYMDRTTYVFMNHNNNKKKGGGIKREL